MSEAAPVEPTCGCGILTEPPEPAEVPPALGLLTARAAAAVGAVIKPANWTKIREPQAVLGVYMHPSVYAVQVVPPYAATDCLGQALSDYGRVCGLGFRFTGPEQAHVRIYGTSKAALGGNLGYWWPNPNRVYLATGGGDGTAAHDKDMLCHLFRHEIGHTLGSLGFPGEGHTTDRTAAMLVGSIWPAKARYHKRSDMLAAWGLAGFSWPKEIGYLQGRFGGPWLWYVEGEAP